MKNRKHLFVNAPFVVLAIALLLGINSCEKENTDEFVAQAEIVAEYVRAEDYMADLLCLMHSSIYDTALINNGQAFIDSTFVTYQMGAVSGSGTFLFDFDSPNQPASTAAIYSGQVTATLDQPFGNGMALMQATFDNYVINGYLLQGHLNYQNTGEFVDGKQKYLLQYDLNIFLNDQKLLSYSPARDLFWTEGFDTPEDYQDDEFSMNQGAVATYYDPSTTSTVLTITITSEFTEEWLIGISCFRYFRHGTFDAYLGDETSPNVLKGEFLDADYDNCADKLMIKNSDGSLGYPYYL